MAQPKVEVYYESSSHSELVAVFESEELYDVCRDALVKDANESRMILTESVIEDYETTEKE